MNIQEGMVVSLTKGSKNWCMLAIAKLFLDTQNSVIQHAELQLLF